MIYNYKTGVIVPFAQRFYKQMTIAVAGLFLATFAAATLGVSAAPASVIYTNIPSPIAGNYPSLAFESTSTSEFGGQITLAGVDRTNPKVTVLMSSWGCESGSWNLNSCMTTPGTTFPETITLNLYNVDSNNSVGSLITTSTKTFSIPYRPSSDVVRCIEDNAGKWYDTVTGTCKNGLATPVSFKVNGTLPSNVIVSLAYNTTHYGYAPIGEGAVCYTEDGGCGYDSLNVALISGLPIVGTYTTPNDAYVNSTWVNGYYDGQNVWNGGYCLPATIGGTFKLDQGCWTGYQPAIKVEAMESAGEECKKDGWKTLKDSKNNSFKNQGDCVSYFATGMRNAPAGDAAQTATRRR